MMVNSLPVIGNDPGGEGEQVRGEVGDPYPRKDKESGVISQQVPVTLPGFRRPTDEGVTAGNGIRGRREGNAGQEPLSGKGQILEVLANWLRVTEVVELLNQTVEKFFLV